jgi:hypothetical protein
MRPVHPASAPNKIMAADVINRIDPTAGLPGGDRTQFQAELIVGTPPAEPEVDQLPCAGFDPVVSHVGAGVLSLEHIRSQDLAGDHVSNRG